MSSKSRIHVAAAATLTLGALGLLAVALRGWSEPAGADAESRAPSEASADGELAIEPAEVIVRQVESDDPPLYYPAAISLKNVGSGPLTITKVDPRCGCTAPFELARSLLQPGEAVPLKLEVLLPPYGTRNTTLVVTTDSASTPEVTVPLVLHGPALAAPYIQDAPRGISLVGKHPGDLLEEEILIRAIEPARDQWVTGLVSSSGAAECRLVELANEERLTETEVRRVYRFAIRVRAPDTVAATTTDSLRITTGKAESIKPVPPIRLVATLRPPIRAVPEKVVLRADGSGPSGREQRVLLLAADESPWSLSLPPDLPPWLQVVEEAAPDGATAGPRRLRFTISNLAGAEDSARNVVVKMSCTHPECESIAIPVSVLP